MTPASGNFIYLESQPGDYIGGGRNYLYSQRDAVLAVSTSERSLSVNIDGDQGRYASFEAMNTLSRLEVGYYGDLQRYPFHNPTRGGISWGGEGRGCNTLSGWFVVDDIVYTNGVLSSVDLRFEQHCEGVAAALRGQIHWNASDTTVPPGPITPPSGLSEPGPGITPASGNFIYLESQPGDYVGNGRNLPVHAGQLDDPG